MDIDARKIAAHLGDLALRAAEDAILAEQSPETGSAHDVPLVELQERIEEGESMTPDYLIKALRRSYMGTNWPKGNRWKNRKRAKLRIYFGLAGGVDSSHKNPAAALNKLRDSRRGMRGKRKARDSMLGVGGKVDKAIEAAMGRYLADIVAGEIKEPDTRERARGKS